MRSRRKPRSMPAQTAASWLDRQRAAGIGAALGAHQRRRHPHLARRPVRRHCRLRPTGSWCPRPQGPSSYRPVAAELYELEQRHGIPNAAASRLLPLVSETPGRRARHRRLRRSASHPAARRADMGRRRPLGSDRRQPQARRSGRWTEHLPHGPRAGAARRPCLRRAGDRHAARRFPRHRRPATGLPMTAARMASPACWRSIPSQVPVINAAFTPDRGRNRRGAQDRAKPSPPAPARARCRWKGGWSTSRTSRRRGGCSKASPRAMPLGAGVGGSGGAASSRRHRRSRCSRRSLGAAVRAGDRRSQRRLATAPVRAAALSSLIVPSSTSPEAVRLRSRLPACSCTPPAAPSAAASDDGGKRVSSCQAASLRTRSARREIRPARRRNASSHSSGATVDSQRAAGW